MYMKLLILGCSKRKHKKKIFLVLQMCEKPPRRYTYCGRYIYCAYCTASMPKGVHGGVYAPETPQELIEWGGNITHY